ncbi:NAD(P)-binding protein [Serendipita vermifera]|nr:NAD(P)-binding protein [Serendipita vermifera]
MVNVLILGGTGPTGLALIDEALSRNYNVVIYARSPQKLPEDVKSHPCVIIIKGSLEDEEMLAKAFEAELPANQSHDEGTNPDSTTSQKLNIDAVISALGPPVKWIHPAGHPLAKGYERVVRIAKEKGVRRFIVLGTASNKDEHDKFDLRFRTLVFGVEHFAPHAYEDMVAIGDVFKSQQDLDWTIARIPVLLSTEAEKYVAGYIGDGQAKPFLTRPLFARFVFDEIEQRQWIRKQPLVSWQ